MRFDLAFAVVLAAFVAATAQAQQAQQTQQQPGQGMRQGTRIAGAVKSVTSSDLVLATANGDVDIAITTQTRVLARQAANASEIKPGAYLGTSNQDGAAAGTGTATEVHLMDDGPNVNSPMNTSGLTMTNGHVKAVTPTATGEEMDVDYGQATPRHVVVNKDTTVTRMVDVGVAGLKPGVNVSAVTTSSADGKPTATFISVNPATAKPAP